MLSFSSFFILPWINPTFTSEKAVRDSVSYASTAAAKSDFSVSSTKGYTIIHCLPLDTSFFIKLYTFFNRSGPIFFVMTGLRCLGNSSIIDKSMSP